MKAVWKIAVATGLIAGLSLSTWAADAQGQAAAYLKFGVDARILGMGGAGVATTNDVNATYWNPAGMSQMQDREMGFMHTSLSLDRNYNYFSVGLPSKDKRWKFGASYHRFSVTGIPETKVYGFDVDGNGLLDDPILTGDPLGATTAAQVNTNPNRATDSVKIFSYFEDSESYFSLSAARELRKKLSVGGTVKFLRQTLFTEKADGTGFDLGFQYYASDRLTVGLSFRDLFESMDWSTGRSDDVPVTTTLGGALKLENDMLVALDLVKREGENTTWRMGAEKVFFDRYAMRVGNNDGEFTMGASAKWNDWTFDYAYNDEDLGSVQRISAKRKF
jgi:hypothetical protein